MQLYNEICVSFSKVQKIDGARRKAVAARFKTYPNIETFETLFRKTEASSFMKGENDRNWRADFDWIMKPTNMCKVLEGKYDDKGGPDNGNEPPSGSPLQAHRLYSSRVTTGFTATRKETGRSHRRSRCRVSIAESSGITKAKNSVTWATGSSGSPPLFLATAREQSRQEKRNGSNGSRRKSGKPRTKSDAGCHVSDVTQV